MQQDKLRNTGKFKPYEQIIQQSYSTNSVIKLPSYCANKKIRNILWARRCGEYNEKLTNFDGCPQYVCSQLDKDCLIQVFVECQLPNGIVQSKSFMFGPIALQSQYKYLLDEINNDNQIFEVQIIGHKKNYNCLITVQLNKMIIKNKNPRFTNQHIISLPDLIVSYVKKIQNTPVLILPSSYFRVVPLKLFKEIIEGNYASINDHLIIKVLQSNQYKIHGEEKLASNMMQHKNNIKWKKFLLKINNIKQNAYRTVNSMINTKKSTTQPFACNKIPMTRAIDHPRYSEMTGIHEKNRENQRDASMKKSQTFDRNNNMEKKKQQQIVPDCQYLTQFGNLLFDDKQQKAEVLQLNTSFEENDKNVNKQQQQKLKQQVKAKKRQRQLKKKLNDLIQEREKYLNDIEVLKQQIKILQKQRRANNPQNQINQLKQQVHQKRLIYQKCIQQWNRKKQEQRKSIGF